MITSAVMETLFHIFGNTRNMEGRLYMYIPITMYIYIDTYINSEI